MKGFEATKKEYGSDSPAEVRSLMSYLEAVDNVKHSTDPEVVARLTEQHHLYREHIPTSLSNSKEVST